MLLVMIAFQFFRELDMLVRHVIRWQFSFDDSVTTAFAMDLREQMDSLLQKHAYR
jgi:hypothetical protein